jgi:hypothetical protein
MKALATALVKFNMEMGKITKDSKNPFFKSSYASLPHILEAVRPHLVSCGLSVVQMPTGDGMLRTILMHESGEFIESEFSMKLVKADPQALGSAITYARRYAIGAILNLSIDEDDDANSAMASTQDPQVSQDEKQWFNATKKDGTLTADAIKVCKLFMNGKRTWEQFYDKYKLSKADKQAMIAYIEKAIIDGMAKEDIIENA